MKRTWQDKLFNQDVYKRQVHNSLCRRLVNNFRCVGRTLSPSRICAEKISNNHITLKLEKSKFLSDEVQFLGFNLSGNGITPSQEKVECIQKFPTPKNKKQLQSFLGLCNYYRKFQKNYSEMTAKFSHQLSSKNKWTWGVEQDLSLIHI